MILCGWKTHNPVPLIWLSQSSDPNVIENTWHSFYYPFLYTIKLYFVLVYYIKSLLKVIEVWLWNMGGEKKFRECEYFCKVLTVHTSTCVACVLMWGPLIGHDVSGETPNLSAEVERWCWPCSVRPCQANLRAARPHRGMAVAAGKTGSIKTQTV